MPEFVILNMRRDLEDDSVRESTVNKIGHCRYEVVICCRERGDIINCEDVKAKKGTDRKGSFDCGHEPPEKYCVDEEVDIPPLLGLERRVGP